MARSGQNDRLDKLEQSILILDTRVKSLTAERDDWRIVVGKFCSIIPVSDIIGVTGTVQDTVDYFKGVIAERDALRKALKPFAFLGEKTTQEAWEMRYKDRFQDWIDFDDMETARKALLPTPPKETP